jgi:uncharacterized membrane protein YcgQ (UPF0703/DUF1980 family)
MMIRSLIVLCCAVLCSLLPSSVLAKEKEIVVGDKLFITTLNDIYTNLEDLYKDTRVTFEGNLEMGVFDDPVFEGKMFPYVYRLGPGCCYNDAYAGMYLDYDGKLPPDNTWVRVSGYVVYFEHNGFTDLFLKTDSLTVLDKPGLLTVKD